MSGILMTEPMLLVLKATLLLGLGGLLTVVTGRFPAAMRHLVWSATLAGLLALPVLSFGLPNWTLPVLPEGLAPEAPTPSAAHQPVLPEPTAPTVQERQGDRTMELVAPPQWGESGSVTPSGARPSPDASAANPAGNPAGDRLPHPLLLIWGIGTLAVLGWIALGQLGVYRIRRSATPLASAEWQSEAYDAAWLLDITRPVTLLKGAGNATPMTWGLVWPTVLLPGSAEDWSAEHRRMVLLHELAHVRRKDCLTQLVAHLACALFWFHPLVWYASRRLRVERERACDDLVVRTGTPAPDYADHLLHVARTLRVPRASATAIAMARPSHLEGRLLAVLDPDRPRHDSPLLLRGAAVMLVFLLTVPLALVQPGFASAASNPAEIVLGGPGTLAFPQDDPPHGGAMGEHDKDPADQATRPLSAIGALDPDLQWEGTVRRGGTLSVHNANGAIRAVGTTAARASVAGTRGTDRRNREVRLETVEHAGGVTVCVVPEGARCTPDGVQDDSRSGRGPLPVSLSVQVPAGVHFKTASMNGALRIENVAGNVDATSMNGAVHATASGHVRAKSMNGAVTADMQRTDWNGDLAVESMNGAVHVILPDNASTSVNAVTMSGAIRSDFPLNLSRGPGPSSARGTIGNGGRTLTVSSMNGSVRIGRRGGPLPGAISANRTSNQRSAAEHEMSGSVESFAESMARFGESMATIGTGIAASVTSSVLAALGGEMAARHHLESPDIYIERLRNDPDAEVRRVAAWGLAHFDAAGVDALSAALRSDRDAGVREMAAWSLGSLEEAEGAEALRHAVRNDSDPKVRFTAFWALELADPDAAAGHIPVAITDRHVPIRERAAWMIGDLEAGQHFDALVGALRDEDARVREKAAWSFGRLEDPRALPHLSRALDDSAPSVRKAALWAATRIDDDATTPLLERASRDADPELRRLALSSMAGGPWPWPWPWPMPMPRPLP